MTLALVRGAAPAASRGVVGVEMTLATLSEREEKTPGWDGASPSREERGDVESEEGARYRAGATWRSLWGGGYDGVRLRG